MTVEEEYYDDADYGKTSTGHVHDKNRELARRLPGYLPSHRGSGHYNLLYPAAEQIANLEHDILGAARAQRPQTILDGGTSFGEGQFGNEKFSNPHSMDTLAKLGEMYNTPPKENETIEHYRNRLLAEEQIATGEGTPNDIIEGAAEILDIDSSTLVYSEPVAGSSENGTVSVEFPGAALDDNNLTASEVADFLDRLAPFGCRVEGLTRGTFTYITPTDYNGNNHDASKGYDGLDGNGDPKDNGGTYAGAV